MKKLILICLLLSACSSYNPPYDPKSSIDGGKNFYVDLQQCENVVDRNTGFWDSEHWYERVNNCLKHRDYSILD